MCGGGGRLRAAPRGDGKLHTRCDDGSYTEEAHRVVQRGNKERRLHTGGQTECFFLVFLPKTTTPHFCDTQLKLLLQTERLKDTNIYCW